MSARTLGRTPLDVAFARDASGLLQGALLALIAYLATLGGLALVLLGDDLRTWDSSLANSLTVQVPAEASAARLETSLALLRQTPGIASVRLLESAETARLLEPWLGAAATMDTLPIPRLIDIQTDPRASLDLADLRQKLASIAPGSQLDDHRSVLDGHRRAAIRFAVVIAIGIAAAAVLAFVLTTALTNMRVAVHRAAVELLHLLGAEDAAIAWPVQIGALRGGIIGGAIGAAAALITLIVIGRLMPLHTPASAADWRLWGVAVAVVAVIGVGAMSVARIAVLRRLSMP